MAFEKIDAKKQRKITNDWATLFPTYRREKHHRVLSRRVGPLVLSIWYQMGRGSEEYYIKFTAFTLLRENVQPSSLLESEPSSRADLPWIFHEQGIYKRLAQELRATAFVPMEGPVTLSQIIEAYKKRLMRVIYNLEELRNPALIAAWAGKHELAEELVEWSYQLATKGENPPAYLEEMKAWRKSLEERIKHPERLREIVNKNVERLELTKIPYEDLIID